MENKSNSYNHKINYDLLLFVLFSLPILDTQTYKQISFHFSIEKTKCLTKRSEHL